MKGTIIISNIINDLNMETNRKYDLQEFEKKYIDRKPNYTFNKWINR